MLNQISKNWSFLVFVGCLAVNFYMTSEDPTMSAYFQTPPAEELIVDNSTPPAQPVVGLNFSMIHP